MFTYRTTLVNGSYERVLYINCYGEPALHLLQIERELSYWLNKGFYLAELVSQDVSIEYSVRKAA